MAGGGFVVLLFLVAVVVSIGLFVLFGALLVYGMAGGSSTSSDVEALDSVGEYGDELWEEEGDGDGGWGGGDGFDGGIDGGGGGDGGGE